MKKIFLFCLLLGANSLAIASEALVNHQWLGQHLNDKNLLIVDLRPKAQYEYAHIKGSSHTDIELWRKPKGGVESMLPDKAHLEMLMSTMGAKQDSHIVLVASGNSAGELASAVLVERLSKVPPPSSLSSFVTAVEAAILDANSHLRQLSYQRSVHRSGQQTIGSTVACLLVHGAHCVCAWAGDSRIYRLRRA